MFLQNCDVMKHFFCVMPASDFVTLLIVDDLFAGAEPTDRSRERLCAYRNLVFWCWPHIKKKERKPLPSCLVGLVRAMFPPTPDEEEFADWQFSGFCYGEDEFD